MDHKFIKEKLDEVAEKYKFTWVEHDKTCYKSSNPISEIQLNVAINFLMFHEIGYDNVDYSCGTGIIYAKAYLFKPEISKAAMSEIVDALVILKNVYAEVSKQLNCSVQILDQKIETIKNNGGNIVDIYETNPPEISELFVLYGRLRQMIDALKEKK